MTMNMMMMATPSPAAATPAPVTPAPATPVPTTPSPVVATPSPASTPSPIVASPPDSAFEELAWTPACESSPYDFVGSLEFCRDGAVFGYRLASTDSCGGLNPLIRMQAGKSYQLRLENGANQITNIHTHGLHIPGSGNADDITRHVNPGQCLFYNWTIPDDHLDGTFWYHAHVHGFTNQQVNGGALGVLLIDPADTAEVPPVHIQNFIHNERVLLLATTRNQGVDTHKANGQDSAATLELTRNTWTRLRIVVGDPNAQVRNLNFNDEHCAVHPVAYDGVWRTTVPGAAAWTYSVTGATRIDLAVKCSTTSGLWYANQDILFESPLVTLSVSGDGSDGDFTPANTPAWEPVRPGYLLSLLEEDASTTFSVTITPTTLNNVVFDPDVPLGTFTHGTLQQWSLSDTRAHPYHLHLYHMQVVTPGGCGNIYEEGQWYDVISSSSNDAPCLVRFRMDDIGGRVIMHCHILRHEDSGVMGWVDVIGGPPHGVSHIDEQECDTECFSSP